MVRKGGRRRCGRGRSVVPQLMRLRLQSGTVIMNIVVVDRKMRRCVVRNIIVGATDIVIVVVVVRMMVVIVCGSGRPVAAENGANCAEQLMCDGW